MFLIKLAVFNEDFPNGRIFTSSMDFKRLVEDRTPKLTGQTFVYDYPYKGWWLFDQTKNDFIKTNHIPKEYKLLISLLE